MKRLIPLLRHRCRRQALRLRRAVVAKHGPSMGKIVSCFLPQSRAWVISMIRMQKILLFATGLLCAVHRNVAFPTAVFLQLGLPHGITSSAASRGTLVSPATVDDSGVVSPCRSP